MIGASCILKHVRCPPFRRCVMAGAILCVSCAQLPTKNRSLAVRKTRCPECQAEFGVTSYGSAFRIKAAPRRLFSPLMMAGISFGAGFLTFLMLLVGLGMWSGEVVSQPRRAAQAPPPDELTLVREVAVDRALPANSNPSVAKQNIAQLVAKIKNTNNGANKDAFVLANMKTRPELQGMPFVMGKDCRLDGHRAQSFQVAVEA